MIRECGSIVLLAGIAALGYRVRRWIWWWR